MSISANDLKTGNIILHDNRFLLISKTMHTQPGKGGAYIQVEMKDIKTRIKINHRFRSRENITRIRLEQQIYQFLYQDKNTLLLMDKETFEQRNINLDLLSNKQLQFLQEGMDLVLEVYSNDPLFVKLPPTTEIIVKECEPVVKGQTSASSYKPAILANGVRIMVPPFINAGNKIIIDIKELKYLERVQ